MNSTDPQYQEHKLVNHLSKRILQGKKKFLHVELPTPQVAGTYTQCVCYADQKAQEIYDNHFKTQ